MVKHPDYRVRVINQSGDYPQHVAARMRQGGIEGIMKAILEADTEHVVRRNSFDQTALGIAMNRNLGGLAPASIIRLLATPEEMSAHVKGYEWGELTTVVHKAALIRDEEVMALLLDHDPECVALKDCYGCTVLHRLERHLSDVLRQVVPDATALADVKTILESYVDILEMVVDAMPTHALQYVCPASCMDFFDERHNTIPVSCVAAFLGNTRLLRKIQAKMDGIDTGMGANNANGLLFFASAGQHQQTMEMVLDAGVEEQDVIATAKRAAKTGDMSVVRSLGARQPFWLDLADEMDVTPLMEAVCAGQFEVAAHILALVPAAAMRVDWHGRNVAMHAVSQPPETRVRFLELLFEHAPQAAWARVTSAASLVSMAVEGGMVDVLNLLQS